MSVATSESPHSRSLMIKNGRIVTMDPDLGVLEGANIIVRNGVIETVNQTMSTSVDDIIDATDTLIIPGLVDTHTHMWNGIWRHYIDHFGDRSGYEPLSTQLGPLFAPEDSYSSVLGAALEMIHGGITTVHNWAHNVLTEDHADAENRALLDAHIRSRFSYGYHWNLPTDRPMDLDAVLAIKKRWTSSMNQVGMALRNDNGTDDPDGPQLFPTISVPHAIIAEEMAFARANGIPLTTHLIDDGPPDYWLDHGFIAPDNLIVHGYLWDEDDWQALGKAGIRMSVTPYSAAKPWWGKTVPINEMAAANVPVGLSFDTMGGPGRADMFRLMQLLVVGQKMRTGTALPFHDALHLATAGGAEALGLSDHIGTITPGKQADIVVISTNNLGNSPTMDPYAAIVNGTGPELVRDVIIGGKIVKRHGSLVDFDVSEVAADVTRTFSRLLDRYTS